MMSDGRVFLVGAGPGDPELITVRGRELLARAEVVVYDYLASPRLLACAPPDAELMFVGKRASHHTLRQEEINDLLVSLGRQGRTVVRLKGGDPFVFGRGGEEALALADAGIPFEVVPGITAGVAAPAYAGIPVTHRKLASSLGLITGHETPDKEGSDLDFEALARWKGTLAFYMGVGRLAAICKSLTDRGLPGETPAGLIRWGTTARQQVLTGTLANLPQLAQDADFQPPAIIIIGEVVRLREKLKWFERRPLFGRRIVVTRARAQASELTAKLQRLGAEVVEMPTIRIEPPQDPGPLAQAVAELESFDWIVFASANAVTAFFAALAEAGLDARALHANRICVVGPATGGCLERFGLRADARPAKFTASEIVETLASQQDLAGVGILLPRADIAPPGPAEALAERGAVVRQVTAYRTVPDGAGAERVEGLLAEGGIHWITFTSSSTVKNFFKVTKDEKVRSAAARLASIGPATTLTLGQLGYQPDAQADPHTIQGLVDAILEVEGSGGRP
jgi:uroporphyrinogen III methyltransferase/synthase